VQRLRHDPMFSLFLFSPLPVFRCLRATPTVPFPAFLLASWGRIPLGRNRTFPCFLHTLSFPFPELIPCSPAMLLDGAPGGVPCGSGPVWSSAYHLSDLDIRAPLRSFTSWRSQVFRTKNLSHSPSSGKHIVKSVVVPPSPFSPSPLSLVPPIRAAFNFFSKLLLSQPAPAASTFSASS